MCFTVHLLTVECLVVKCSAACLVLTLAVAVLLNPVPSFAVAGRSCVLSRPAVHPLLAFAVGPLVTL